MLIFNIGLHKKTNGWYGIMQIKHNPTDGVIQIPIPDGKTATDVSRTALNILKCIQYELNKTIDIVQKHIDDDCKHLPKVEK